MGGRNGGVCTGTGFGFTRGVAEALTLPTIELLNSTGSAQAAWHEQASAVTRERFGGRVFVRVVVEISNFCRENCAYCGMRRENRRLERYRARLEDLTRVLLEGRPDFVTDVNLQAGEDPVAVREVALPLIRRLRRETRLGISVCLGTLPAELYAELREAGASIYIMKFEIGDAAEYERFEAPGTLAERLEHIRLLARGGWQVSSGFIAGLPGRGVAGALVDLELARTLPLVGCSVSPFIPGESTPLDGAAGEPGGLTLNCLAALRLMRPDWVIPAVSALNLAGEEEAYRRAFRLGANLATINLTPPENRGDYVIYRRDRAIMTGERIARALDAEGLTISRMSLSEFYATRESVLTASPRGVPASATVPAHPAAEPRSTAQT